MDKEFILSRIKSRILIFLEKDGRRSISYNSYPIVDFSTLEGVEREKILAEKILTNNATNVISVSYGEGHLHFAQMIREGDSVKWVQREDFN